MNKYWNARDAQRKDKHYNYFRILQKEWTNTPVKTIAMLQQFINDNKDFL